MDRPATAAAVGLCPAPKEIRKMQGEPAPMVADSLALTPPHLIGCGRSIAHHGEILQGVFAGPGGRFQRGLVTLPCAVLRSSARFDLDPASPLNVEPSWKVKALEAARLALRHFDRPSAGGRLIIRSDIPPRWGFGSSTSDVIAALQAVASALNRRLPCDVVAALAVRAETASDAVMFEDRAVLFAQRAGVVLEDFGCALPPLDVLGFNADATGCGVDTLLTPPAEYSWWECQAFRPLLGLLRRALHAQDPRLLGQVASASARINQRHFAKPCFDRLEELVREVGAVGLQVAHTGSVFGFLFDSCDVHRERRIDLARCRLAALGLGPVWHFRTGESEPALGSLSA
jgi:uncharacterized protein involved in propanediol utilization